MRLLLVAVLLAGAIAAEDKEGEESAGGDNSCQYASDGVCDEEGHPNCGKTPDGRDACCTRSCRAARSAR
jgi:hypothetical protein